MALERDNQWDIRVHVPTAIALNNFIGRVNALFATGKIKYVTIGGVERAGSAGTNHVHVALCLQNQTSKQSVISQYIVNRADGYNVQKRDRSVSFEHWLKYHRKTATKINPEETVLLELGTRPRDRRADYYTPAERDEAAEGARNRKYEQWKERRALMEADDYNELDYKYPGFRWSSAGINMQREVLKQKTHELNQPLNGPLNNWIIWGPTGTGKSSSVNLLYPNAYKKQKGSQYWDGYDLTNPDHGVVWIDEFSSETLKTIAGKQDGGFEFLKELCDRYPVTVDEKYTKGYKIRPKSIIITMNEHPSSLLPKRAIEINKAALWRKCHIIHITEWLKKHRLTCTAQGVKSLDQSGSETEDERLSPSVL